MSLLKSRHALRPFLAFLAGTEWAAGQTTRLLMTGVHAVVERDTTQKVKLPCYLVPLREGCRAQVKNASGEIPDRTTFINSFYETFSNISFLGQVKSVYNGSASAATVSADLASLNFITGMQVTVTTNVEAGSVGAVATSAIGVSSGLLPTITAASAGQATQNILSGGTVVSSVIYPLVAVGAANVTKAGAFGLSVDLAGREGVDIQNFKAGTSTTASSPSSHSSAGIEGYMYLNATNDAAKSNVLAGTFFVGGVYGINYMSHDYARDYGFGNHFWNGVGQVSFGVLLNNVAKISVSRGFGPTQSYIDSTSMAKTSVNNFKSWSIGVTYQSAPAGVN